MPLARLARLLDFLRLRRPEELLHLAGGDAQLLQHVGRRRVAHLAVGAQLANRAAGKARPVTTEANCLLRQLHLQQPQQRLGRVAGRDAGDDEPVVGNLVHQQRGALGVDQVAADVDVGVQPHERRE